MRVASLLGGVFQPCQLFDSVSFFYDGGPSKTLGTARFVHFAGVLKEAAETSIHDNVYVQGGKKLCINFNGVNPNLTL